MQWIRQISPWSIITLLSGSMLAILLPKYSELGVKFSNWLVEHFTTVHIIFFSIVIEALPFVLIGVIGSFLLEIFVSPELIRKLLPKSLLPAVVVSGLLGVIFPFCECGLVPIIRKLIEKGVPAHLAVVMLLTIPIVNPIVGLATSYAFYSQPEIVAFRLGGAFVIAIIIGLVTLAIWGKKSILIKGKSNHCACGCSHSNTGLGVGRISGAINHCLDEFFSIMKYLIIGALMAAIMQVYIPREWLNLLGGNSEVSVGVMMIAAFFLSICSGADAFVASTFVNTFTAGALVTFLVYGPMIDLKNLLMLRAVFKTRFVLYLVTIVSITVFSYGILINQLGVIR
ncbi:permease [Dendrosporobacter sp. 1207_IL3150]|uniref:permease n=1 Tax=Dendrosporobacter sp. 1207_IL3150 TaxID=3084054 RepID=UPI002FDB00B9